MEITIGKATDTFNLLKDVVLPGVQIVAPFLAACMILVQIRMNIDHANKKDQDKIRYELQSKLYTEIEEKSSLVSEAIQAARSFCNSISITSDFLNRGNDSQYSVTALDYSSVKSNVLSGVADLIISYEKYEIVLPELNIFKTAFMAYSFDVHFVDGEFVPLLLTVLPVDVTTPDGNSTRLYQPRPDASTIVKLIAQKDKFEQIIGQVEAVMSDLRVELQNILLGPIFKRSILHREPLDPASLVIRTDPVSVLKLNDHFENQTAWGAMLKRVNGDVAKRFESK